MDATPKCEPNIDPRRNIPSSIRDSDGFEKFNLTLLRAPLLSRFPQKAIPGMKATLYSFAAIFSSRVVSISSGKRTHRKNPHLGMLHTDPRGNVPGSAANITFRR